MAWRSRVTAAAACICCVLWDAAHLLAQALPLCWCVLPPLAAALPCYPKQQLPTHLSSDVVAWSMRKRYWKPEQPPPSTSTRSMTGWSGVRAWSCLRRCKAGAQVSG
jgi:hypothetical protein